VDFAGSAEEACGLLGVRRRNRYRFGRAALLGLPASQDQRLARDRTADARARVSTRYELASIDCATSSHSAIRFSRSRRRASSSPLTRCVSSTLTKLPSASW